MADELNPRAEAATAIRKYLNYLSLKYKSVYVPEIAARTAETILLGIDDAMLPKEKEDAQES